MAFHHSSNIFQEVKKLQVDDKKIYKTNGSYIHKPLIDQALSSNNRDTRHVLKTMTMTVGNKQDTIRSYQGLPGTVKIYKIPESSRKIIRRHYRIDIKQYLKRKYQKPAYLLPLEAFQCLRQIKPSEDKPNQLFQTKLLYLYKPFFSLDNLKHVLDTERKCIQIQNLAGYCRSLLSVCISYGGLDNFLMTSSNLYFQDDFESFTINYTSFVGLAFINSKAQDQQVLGVQQFMEVYPHLTTSILKNGLQVSKQNIDIPKYSKMRSLMINVLCLFVRRDIYFKPITDKTSEVHRSKAQKQYVSKISEEWQKLYKTEITPEPQRPQKLIKIFSHFIERIRQEYFFKTSEQQKKPEQTHKKQIFNRLEQNQRKFVLDKVAKFDKIAKKLLINEDFSLLWENFIDLFADYSENEGDRDLDDAFEDFHKMLWEKEENKEFYLNRCLSGSRLYLPIRFNAEIPLLLKHKNWWDFLNQTKFNFLHQAFTYKLLSALIDIYETEKIGQDIRRDSLYIKITEYIKKSEMKNLEISHVSNCIQQIVMHQIQMKKDQQP